MSGDVSIVPWRDALVPQTDAMQLPKMVDQNYYNVQSYSADNFISQLSTGLVGAGVVFTVNGLPQTSALTSVFDQYRILGVEVFLNPHTTIGESFATTGPPSGLAYSVIDYDNSSTPSTVAQMLSYATCITSPITSRIRRCLRPRMALAAYSGAFTSYANMQGEWIDAVSPSVQHYGLKVLLDIGTAGNLQSYDLVYRVYTEWRATQ